MTETIERFDTAQLEGVADDLSAALPALIEDAADPDGVGLASLLHDVRRAREKLLDAERALERETAKAMSSDMLEVAGAFRVERHRTRERKEWAYDDWTADARRNLLRRRGLLGAVGVVTRDGEVVDVSLTELLREAESVHGKGQPRLTALRKLGLDPDEYCSATPGQPRVSILPLADETGEGSDDRG